MADFFEHSKAYAMRPMQILSELETGLNGWRRIHHDVSDNLTVLVYLTGMFSGAGFLGLFSHGARKSLVLIKIEKLDDEHSRVYSVAGGTETLWGFDFGRHRRNVMHVFNTLDSRRGYSGI